MTKEEIIFIHRVITFLSAFPQTISLVTAENHLERTKLPIQLYSEKNTKIILLMQLECPLPKK